MIGCLPRRRPLAWGWTFRSVAPGVASFPITTAGATGAQRAKEQEAAAAVWSVGLTELKPTRDAVHATFVMEDAARLPGLEDALTRDLGMALTDAIDKAIFVGDAGATGADADITGLQTAADVVEKTITQANKVKGSAALQSFAELIDGKHAISADQLQTVLSVGAMQLWMYTLANSGNSVDTTILEFLRRAGITATSRADIETATTNDKFGAFIGRARGIEGAGVAAIWESAQLIRDPYSGAKKGEIALTLNYLWNFGLPRPANFARIKFVT